MDACWDELENDERNIITVDGQDTPLCWRNPQQYFRIGACEDPKNMESLAPKYSLASVMRVLPIKLTNPSTTIARPKSDKDDATFFLKFPPRLDFKIWRPPRKE
jgi:hypothetical protein